MNWITNRCSISSFISRKAYQKRNVLKILTILALLIGLKLVLQHYLMQVSNYQDNILSLVSEPEKMVKLAKIPNIRVEVNKESLKQVVRQLNRKGCQPKGNLVFLKTHKCGSTSLFNTFIRYGLSNDKIVALPIFVNYHGHPDPFKRSMVRSLEKYNQEYNILTHHSRLNYTEMRDFMPNDTIFLTIVRDPVFQYESMTITYNLKNFWNLSIEQLNVRDPEIPEVTLNKRVNGRIGINQMIFDMGLDVENFTQPRDVSQYISRLDTIFDLVLIMERMEESLVLLKHLMCWKTEDVITFKLNSRTDPAYIQKLTKTEKKSIRDLNWADTQLYNHFKRKFELLVKRFGRKRMDREVNELRDKSRKWYQMCENITETSVSTNDLLKDELKIFQTNQSLCFLLKANELNLTDLVRRRQDEKYPDPSNFFYNKHRRLVIFSFIILLEFFIVLHHFLKIYFHL